MILPLNLQAITHVTTPPEFPAMTEKPLKNLLREPPQFGTLYSYIDLHATAGFSNAEWLNLEIDYLRLARHLAFSEPLAAMEASAALAVFLRGLFREPVERY